MHSLKDLVRFATHQYTNDPAQLGNNFIHLTNYSVNKENKEGFVHAEVPLEEHDFFVLICCNKNLDGKYKYEL